MLKFNNYEHFKRYCFKVAHNKEIKLTRKHYNAFNAFENVIGFLTQLKLSNKIDFKEDPLINISNHFKKSELKKLSRQ